MRLALVLPACLLLAACQLSGEAPSPAPLTRLHGELGVENGQAWLQPCEQSRRLPLTVGESGLLREAAQLGAPARRLYADLDGRSQGDAFHVEYVYRLDGEGHGCDDPNRRLLILRASGHEPDWHLLLNRHGLVLERPGQEPLALPYLEETLPGGSYVFSSEADGRKLELWVAPQRCIDSATGGVWHLQATLTLDDQQLRGCAALGGARER